MSADHGDTNKNLGGKRTYTVEEIAKILGIGRTAAYSLVHSGVFKMVRIGSSIRVSKVSFDDWLDIRDIRETHKKDSESAPQTTVADELKENLEAVENFKGSRDEKLVVLYCKQLGINYKNLSDEEFRWLIRILQKSKKTGTPISQRKKR